MNWYPRALLVAASLLLVGMTAPAQSALPASPSAPQAATPLPTPTRPAGSATEEEVARLARLARADAMRRADTPTVRSAPGRETIEVGGLRRCVDASGASVFTDRRCDALGAGDAPPEAAAAPILRPGPTSVRSCARSKADLLDGVRTALEVHDVNRVAAYYHWAGMGGAEGYRLMDRLESFARRPFVDAQLVSSAAPRTGGAGGDAGETVGLLSRPFDDALPPAVPLPRPHPADLLRVDQMRSDRDAAAQVTWFRLHSNAGCWWMEF